jgi:SAM-dependent methyltransferase
LTTAAPAAGGGVLTNDPSVALYSATEAARFGKLMLQHVDYGIVADIFKVMETETLDGVAFSDVVGGGHPLPLAIHFVSILLDQARLESKDRILDVGCGCGRLAAPLTQHIGPKGTYIGVDIVAGLVDFGTRHITKAYPNFTFLTLDQSNPSYDSIRREGTSRVIKTLDEACEPASVDLCIATSLFTHLDINMSRTTLAAMSRLMAPDGRAFITAFLIDPAVRMLIGQGRSFYQFEHNNGDGTYVQSADRPLEALAYDADLFGQLLMEQGLYIERTLLGKWPGRPFYAAGQDILIVRKVPINQDKLRTSYFDVGRLKDKIAPFLSKRSA